MIEIYQFPTCPFCQKVLRKLDQLKLKENIDYKLIDVYHGTPGRDKVYELGGRSQVPFLVDKKNKIKMYESDSIVDYLEGKFKK